MQEFPVKDNFPDPFRDQFARLVIACGRLEYLLKLCIKDLVADGFTKGMTEAESIRQFQKLFAKAKCCAAEKLPQQQASAFCSLLHQAEDLVEYRHDTVHALWTTNAVGVPLRIRPRWVREARSVDWSRTAAVKVDELERRGEQAEQLYQALDIMRRDWRN